MTNDNMRAVFNNSNYISNNNTRMTTVRGRELSNNDLISLHEG